MADRSCAGARGARPKSLVSDGNFKPEHTLFCRELRFVAIYALFGDLWAKKCLFGSKTVFLGQEVHYYMVYIAYFTELNLQICDYAQKRRICRENCNYALDENFHGHFCPPTKGCQVLPPWSWLNMWNDKSCKIQHSICKFCHCKSISPWPRTKTMCLGKLTWSPTASSALPRGEYNLWSYLQLCQMILNRHT